MRIGAVNCAEDPMLCQSQNVVGYPSLVVFPQVNNFFNSIKNIYVIKVYCTSICESNYKEFYDRKKFLHYFYRFLISFLARFLSRTTRSGKSDAIH